jgi:hypothetical protein
MGRGVVHAKTGTLEHVATLAGYLGRPDGVVVVSLMYNGPRIGPARAAEWELFHLLGAEGVDLRGALETSMGRIVLELYPDKAPRTVANFLSYVKDGHYNGTVFHRVIGDFLIQGGSYTPDMQQKPERAPVANEAGNGLSNLRGTLSAARRASDAMSATSQFFINTVDNR